MSEDAPPRPANPVKPVKRGGLGRGLDALLPDAEDVAALGAQEPASADASAPAELPVDRLYRSRYQPRRTIREEGIDELAQSIRAQGVIEPVIVRPRPAGGYEIIAGERRWRAAQRAGLDAVPAVVRDVDDRQAMAMALIENVQREDLRPLEEAGALKQLHEEYGLTHEALADAVGKSRAAVTNALRLLRLALGVRERLDAGDLEAGHARTLLPLAEADQEAAAHRVVSDQLTVRQTEALVKRMLRGEPKAAASPPDANTQRLERALSERIGAPVSIVNRKGGKGRIVIRYGSLDELDGILGKMGAGGGA